MVEDNGGGGGGGGGLTPLIGTTPTPTTASSLAWECHDGSKVVVLVFAVLVADAYCLCPWRDERISDDVLVVVVAVVAKVVVGICSFFRSSST